MADVQDTLTTVLRVVGFTEVAAAFSQASRIVNQFSDVHEKAQARAAALGAAQSAFAEATAARTTAIQGYLAALHQYGENSLQAASAVTELKVAQDVAAESAEALAVAETAVEAPLLPIILLIGTLTAAFGFLNTSIQAASKEAEQLFRVKTLLQNLGESVPISQFQQLSEEISKSTGFLTRDVESASATFLQMGIHASELPRVLRAVADEARVTGMSFTDVADIVAKGDIGRARGLANLGFGRGAVGDTGTIHGNQALILEEIEKRARGASAAFLQTLPGAQENFARALDNLMRHFGNEFAPMMIQLLNSLAKAMDWLAAHAHEIAGAIKGFLFAGPLGSLIGAWLAHQQGPAAAAVGSDKLATERTLGVIAENTRVMPDLIKGIIGGTGAFRETFATGAVQHAMMI